jgi:peptide deformylase
MFITGEKMKILTYPNERLKIVSKPIEVIDGSIADLSNLMINVMEKNQGVGLAAIQIGIDKRAFVYYNLQGEPDIIINPQILETKGITISRGEGCLSVPGITSNIQRAQTVFGKGVDINGNEFEFEFSGLHSIAFQHEIDHLNGVLFIDYFSNLKRKMYEKKMKKRGLL